jgi:hypothetical protein
MVREQDAIAPIAIGGPPKMLNFEFARLVELDRRRDIDEELENRRRLGDAADSTGERNNPADRAAGAGSIHDPRPRGRLHPA